MIRRVLCAAAALSVALVAYGDDKIGKSPAPEILKKIKGELDKKKGWHCKELLKFPGTGAKSEMSGEGIVKKDFVALKGTNEIYSKGPRTLIKDAAEKFVEPKAFSGADAIWPKCYRNPYTLFSNDILRFAVGARWAKSDEMVDGTECKVAETQTDPGTRDDQLKEVMGTIPPPIAGWDPMSINNPRKSTSAYKVWIGKEDLLIRKIEWVLTMVVDQSKAAGYKFPDKIEATWTIEFSNYDEDLDTEIPKEIQKAFGVK